MNDDTDPRQALQRVWHLIHDMRFCMLASRGPEGLLRSRPLTTQNRHLDDDATLWFFVARDSEPAQDVARDAAVNLAYADLDEDRYVSIAGHAELLDDRERARALWSAMAAAWFPGGADDPNLQLLAVRIVQAEYWDVKASKMVQLWRMAKAAGSGEPPRRMGEHGEVRVR